MRSIISLLILIYLSIASALGQQKTASVCYQYSSTDLLDAAFRSEKGFFDSVLAHLDDWRVQCLYSQIDRKLNGSPQIKTFRLNRDTCFLYPSLSTHLPLAALSYQRIQELSFKGIDLHTTMITESAREEQVPAYNDPRWADGRPTIGRYICNLLLFHDKHSFDRLYEFLGQEYILQEYYRSRYDIRYAGRQQEESEVTASYTNPINFLDQSSSLKYSIPERQNTKDFPAFSNGIFPGKVNALTLESLQELLCGLAYADFSECRHRLRIDREGRDFLMKYMSQTTVETDYPLFSPKEKKHPALAKGISEYEGIRIFHTGGVENGQWLESLFVVDTLNNIEFALSLAMVQPAGVSSEVIDQFFSDLGLVIYDLELNRQRPVMPDLSPFIFNYDN